MSVVSENRNRMGMLRGLFHMRVCEILAKPSIVRLSAAFVIVLGLFWFVGSQSDGPKFWKIAVDLFALGFLPYYCLVKGGEALRSELKEGTIEYLWTRPTRKASLYMGFYLNSLLSVAAFVTACVIAIGIAGLLLGEISSIGQFTLFVFSCSLTSIAFSAIASAWAALTSKFIVLGILYHSIIERLLSQLPTSARNASVLANMKSLISPSSIDASAPWSNISLQGIAYIVLITATALALGALTFNFKSYTIGGEK